LRATFATATLSSMKKTAGNFNPKDDPVYFLASSPDILQDVAHVHKEILIAINEIKSNSALKAFGSMLKKDLKIFVDSGVYNLAMEHATRHNIPHDQALRVPIDEIDGFQELFDLYCKLSLKYQDDVWGTVEIDLGGREQKIKTRAKLEKKGIRPIPVYHPLNDGWDYFDELAKNYDRICVGNIVQASRYVRKHLLATIWERKMRTNPNLWIHILGLAPNEWLCAYPMNSCDASSWLNTVRWNGYKTRTLLKTFSNLPKHFQYELGNRETWEKGILMGAVGGTYAMRNYNRFLKSLRRAKLNEDNGILHTHFRSLAPLARR